MKKNLIIIGGGGFAIECYNIIRNLEKRDDSIVFKGFTAVGETNLKKYDLQKYFLGNYNELTFSQDDYFIIGIGTPSVRKKIFEEFKARNCKFYNLVACNSDLSNIVIKGEGNIICPNSGGAAYKIGNGNLINAFSGLAHDVEIGDFNVISAFCDITGHAKMGDLNFFGSHCVMLPKAKIGNNNKIAAGSVIYKGCKDNCVMQGNPAIKIGNVEDLS